MAGSKTESQATWRSTVCADTTVLHTTSNRLSAIRFLITDVFDDEESRVQCELSGGAMDGAMWSIWDYD